ncbi:hypothetical protein CXB51_008890 [Gossypium anomalum]|uniref:Mitochondrial carrier protein n=1 Tax=Gossypium anomalum TaxID=47600 RepID=A0A8J5ZT67_9ROSI|nr:hypothetical protein CXB51_008890 [Gossypium anomalum]
MVMEQDKVRIASFIFVPSLRGRRWWMTNKSQSSEWQWEEATAGVVAGFATFTAMYPLDVVRTRFQGYERAFCRLLSFSFSFFSFTGLYFFLAKQRYFRNREEKLSPSLHLASAAEAGALVSICTNPIWLIRTRLELQSPLHKSQPYSGVYDALRTMLREEGWTALYTRLGPGLLTQVSHGAIQFIAYEELRRIMVDYEERKKPKGASNLLQQPSNEGIPRYANSWHVVKETAGSRVFMDFTKASTRTF